jgi:hypothetical protein
VDLAISLWGMALNGLIAGVISTLTLLVNFIRIAETAKLQKVVKEDVTKVVEQMRGDEKLDFDAFYAAMEMHAHTERATAQSIFDHADVDGTGLLTKAEGEAMIRHWKGLAGLESQTREQAAAAHAKQVAAKARGASVLGGATDESPAQVQAQMEALEAEALADKNAAAGDVDVALDAEEALLETDSAESWVRVVIVFFVFVFVIVPAVLLLTSLIFGALLADAEGWSWHSGFLYVITNLCILGGLLTDAAPDTNKGRFIDVLIALWTLSVQGTVIGVVGALSIHERVVKAAEGLQLRHIPLLRNFASSAPAEQGDASPAPIGRASSSKSKLQHLETDFAK